MSNSFEQPQIDDQNGDVIPLYEGPNAPIFPNTDRAANLDSLKAMHPQFAPKPPEQTGDTPPEEGSLDSAPVDPSQVREKIQEIKQAAGLPESAPKIPNSAEGATEAYLKGRKRILDS
ncbi:MAG: hypothetical protein ACYCPS_01455 [Candidatus Saccharimonadales bacterium]